MSILEAIKGYLGYEAPKAPRTAINPETLDGERGSWQNFLDEKLARNAEDKVKYVDYELMDAEIPEISAALDVISDFVIYPSNTSKSKVFKVKSRISRNQKTISEIEKVTNFQNEFHSIVRDVCKYGDNFEEILVGEKSGNYVGLKYIPVESIIVNMQGGILQNEPMLKQLNSSNEVHATLNADQCLHYCLRTDRRRYGTTGKGVSRIEKARLIYRQLRLMEEGLMISRLSRSNQNYAIIVDVGDLDGDDALDYLTKYQKRIIRRKYIDNSTGRMSYKYNPLSMMEDIYVPTRQGSGGNVVPLNKGESSSKNIEDIKYFQDKMIYSVGVPKLLIGKETDVNSKSTSDMQYICFLRSIRMIQTMLEPEIIRFFKNALLRKGITDDTLYIEWPVCETIDEERKWKIEQLKCQVASAMSQDLAIVDDEFIYREIFGWDDEFIETLKTRLEEEENLAEEEFNADLALARDDTGNPDADDEYTTLDDNDPSVANSKVNPNKPKKKVSKEEYLASVKSVLSEKDFKKFERTQKIIGENSEIKKLIYDYIHLTNTRIGEF